MTSGAFWSSYTDSIRLLKNLDLLKEENIHKNSYSSTCSVYSRSKEYKEIYQNLVDYRDYDVLLKDDSMFQMNYQNGEYRLVFIQNPSKFMDFETFLDGLGWEYDKNMLDELYGLFDNDYSQALCELGLNSGATYLRYDVDSNGRNGNENIHAYTHLHVGINNNIRIPVGRYMSPLAFTMFVVRHVYYDVWVEAVRNSQIVFNHKNQCGQLPSVLWTNDEKNDFYLY